MKKITLMLLAIMLLIPFAYGQHSSSRQVKQGWQRINLKGVGSIDLPPTMEVQDGTYKKTVNALKNANGMESTDLTAQQKGLNNFGRESFSKYARVMIKTTYGEIGDYDKLDFDVSAFSQDEIMQLNAIIKKNSQQELSHANIRIIDWYPLKVEKINGMSCIHISYLRQLKDNPSVLVHMYSFHNNDRLHSLTLSYRLSEADYWKDDFAKILDSFTIQPR